ncbi:MAG: zinc metallopeptidase [Eubacteriales bacterium]|nr:zinc metallopeptidase [Eubacteriales bacterium]
MYSRYMYYWDPTYILLIIGAIIAMAASARMKSVFAKYSRIASASGLTGEETALRVLRAAGITDVTVRPVAGNLTDHYDPRTKTVNLSETVFHQRSIAALGVAAHECGHAMQHAQGYAPLDLRAKLVPAANIGSQLAWPVFLIGLIVSRPALTTAGIVLFSAAVLFQLVTLPVEFNASRRALAMLENTGILGHEENSRAREVLTAAALTYVAALASSVLQLLRLVLLSGGRRRDD